MPELAAILAKKKFLVVDDVGSMRAIAVNQLRQLGAIEVVEAANGADALRLLAHQHIDMILSDWEMPGVSGLDLLYGVRQDPKLARIPFIMITGEIEREQVHRAIAAGVSALLVKPYTSGRFAERIEQGLRWAQRPAQAAGAAQRTVPPPARAPEDRLAALVETTAPRRPTVLAVDDTPDNLQLLSQLLKNEYRVKVASNGDKALEICQSEDPPDLVLLDVMMPGMDGFEVAERLRSHPNSEHIPVIFITALSDHTSRARGMSLGAVDFVTKPIEPDMLRVRIRNFMRYVELHRQLQADYDEMLEAAQLKDDIENFVRLDINGSLTSVAHIASTLAAAPGRSADERAQLRQIEETILRLTDTINNMTVL